MKKYPELMKKILARARDMDNEIQSWKAHWAEIQENILPAHGRGLTGSVDNDHNQGGKKNSSIYDSTPISSVETLAAGLMAGLTSPARPWFKLSPQDPKLTDYKPVSEWLFEVEGMMRTIFTKSNIYKSLHHAYKELGAFGISPILVKESFDPLITSMAFTVGEYMLATNSEGLVDTFYRETVMTARQVMETFDEDAISSRIKESMEDSPDRKFTICNMIEPNSDGINVELIGNRPIRSMYWEKGNNRGENFLEIRGFDKFPVVSPRWTAIGGDTYGYCPGMTTLPDSKTLHKMQKKSLIALDKVIEPPVLASGRHKGQHINTVPGGVTFDDGLDLGQGGIKPLYEIRPDLQAIEYKIERVQMAIKKGFFNDLFLMLANMPISRQMTATEVAERHQEKLLMLGPVLERLHTELLDPLIDLVFDIMFKNGIIPAPPPELEGQDIRVEYISILSQAQKAVAITAIQNFVSFGGSLASVKENVLDKIDFDEAINQYSEASGISPKLIVSDEEVAIIRADRARQIQMQQAMEMANQAADGAKTMSEASTQGNTVLSQLMGGSQQ